MIPNQGLLSAVQRRVLRRKKLLIQMAEKEAGSPRWQTLYDQYQEVERDVAEIRRLVQEERQR